MCLTGTTQKIDKTASNKDQLVETRPVEPASIFTSADTSVFGDDTTGRSPPTLVPKKRSVSEAKAALVSRKKKLPLHESDKTKDSQSVSTKGAMDSPSADESALTSDFLLNPEQIKGLRLEAIFYPKFDNEHRENQSSSKQPGSLNSFRSRIRIAMMEKVAEKNGYLEVSLKHSGSLILWSGGQRYYSKNSCHNQFTQVAEILLRQHFVRSFWQSDETVSNKERIVQEAQYLECSEYVEQHRLTCAFEVVTAVLGDHGQIPCRDFLILTAVADRKHERFYSTPELLHFCQQFRLPHNDVWTFTSTQSAQQLFDFYDQHRETAKTLDTVKALDQSADSHVSSMYPHDLFQGDILEGFIIRYISYGNGSDECTKRSIEMINRLAKSAQEILGQVPPDKPPCFELLSSGLDNLSHSSNSLPVLETNIRVVFQSAYEADALEHGQRFKKMLSSLLDQKLNDNKVAMNGTEAQQHRHDLEKAPTGNIHLPSLVKNLVGNNSLVDFETQRIAQLLQTLDGVKGAVRYSLLTMPSGSNEVDRQHSKKWFCMLHVLHDTTFFKFQKLQAQDGMSLFRGFCVEILTTAPSQQDVDNAHVTEGTNQNAPPILDGNDVQNVNDNKEPLMLKMKLLPYMVRTFICRNLLQRLEQEGPQAFNEAAETLMDRWGVTEEAKRTWIPFLNGWSRYVVSQHNQSVATDDLGRLTSSSYLHHLERYTKLYEKGDIDTVASKIDAFAGFVCVVSENLKVSKAIADLVAKRLGSDVGGTHEDDKAHLTSNVPTKSLQEAVKTKQTQSCVVYNEIGEKIPGAKAFLSGRKVLKHSLFIFYGSEPRNVVDMDDDASWFGSPSQGESKRNASVWKKVWMNQPCAMRFLLPRSSVKFEPKQKDSAVAAILSTSSQFEEVVATIRCSVNNFVSVERHKKRDTSVLLLFPGIPGCGKSSICDSMESVLQETISSQFQERNSNFTVCIKEGDRLGKKFWETAERLLSDDEDPRPTLLIADKNVPPASWPRIGQICSDTKACPLLALPDDSALETTTVQGAILSDGSFQKYQSHFYPFSLEYLAVSLERVLSRPAGKHAGKLDRGMPIACMLVVQFFSFYRNLSADTIIENFMNKLEESGCCSGSLLQPIKLPILSVYSARPTLPDDLKALLIESLQLRFGHDNSKMKLSSSDEQLIALEERLRSCIDTHMDEIRSMSVSLENSRTSWKTQLLDRLVFLNQMGLTDETSSGNASNISEIYRKIKLVSLDVERAKVHQSLDKLKHECEIKHFLDVVRNNSGEEGSCDPYPPPDFIESPHVTLAFAGRISSAKTLARKFLALQGCKVNVSLTKFIWSSSHAAFGVEVGRQTVAVDGNFVSNEAVDVPACENSFPHITVWCAPGHKAYHANQLPSLVECGKAFEVAVDPNTELTGTIQFWDQSNQIIRI